MVKKWAACASAALALCLACGVLSGCSVAPRVPADGGIGGGASGDSAVESTSDLNKQAEEYYRGKYGQSAQVSSSETLEGTGAALFGPTVDGWLFSMSDGTTVVYYKGSGRFCDDRQSYEIDAAARSFAQSRIDAIPGALNFPYVSSVGFELSQDSYVGCVWATRYDGDIEAFLRAEQPDLQLARTTSGGSIGGKDSFVYDVAYDAAYASAAEEAWCDLGSYFKLRYVKLAVVDPNEYYSKGTDLALHDAGLLHTVSFAPNGFGGWTAEQRQS